MLNLKVSIDELTRLYQRGLTTRQIAPLAGCSPRTVHRHLTEARVPMRNPGLPAIPQLADKEWLEAQYIGLRKNCPQIGAELGCADRSVYHALVRLGIETRPVGSPKGHTRNSTEIAKQRMSASHRGLFIGPNNPNWKGGIALKDPDRNRYPSKVWVKAVKDRDGWQCVECGSQDRLHAHHIKRWVDYPELRYELSNGKTLCHDCHEKAHGEGFKFRWPEKAERPTSASASNPEV